jgi:hypothetical protein
MDCRGRKIPENVRALVDIHILKERSSPPLMQESVLETVETAEDLADSTEGKVSDLIRTPMFPVKRRNIGEGGDTMWSTDTLPSNPLYQHPLSAPKPDYHYGYTAGQNSNWKYKENAIIDYLLLQPYAQPARGNRFPFQAVEIKSEATAGTLYSPYAKVRVHWRATPPNFSTRFFDPLYYNHYHAMPRRPLEEISVNIPCGEELTPYVRSKIVTLHKEGFSIPDISTHTKISKSTVKKTVNVDLHCDDGNSLHRMERPKKYTERDEC